MKQFFWTKFIQKKFSYRNVFINFLSESFIKLFRAFLITKIFFRNFTITFNTRDSIKNSSKQNAIRPELKFIELIFNNIE